MSSPIQQQPGPQAHPAGTHIESYHESLSYYGHPVILGPIVPSIVYPRAVGPQPTLMTCHMCNQEIKTVIYHRPTVKTHLFAICLCIMGLGLCVCIPYCMHSCNKTDHYCSYCSAFLGSYVMD